MLNQYDKHQTYCRQLGHLINFSYCRIMNNKLPCNSVLNCWFELIPIREFIKENYSKEEIEKFLIAPKSRLTKILEAAEKIKKQKTNPD